ncbi:MAG: hypothetical protein Q4D45_04865 [Lachnospiraceae bacterium]|nr:hypothetical protein [Lachnospiraceae bacterium]
MSDKEKYLQEMIDDIEDYVDDGKTSRFNPGKVILERDILMTMLEDLRGLVPTEIERSHIIVQSKQNIMDEAKAKADVIIQNAIKEASVTVEGHEIVNLAKKRAADLEKQAQEYADELVNKAKQDAREIRLGAMEYTRDMMDGIGDYMESLKKAQTTIYSQLLDGISDEISDIMANGAEIEEQIQAMTSAGKESKARTMEDFMQQDKGEKK